MTTRPERGPDDRYSPRQLEDVEKTLAVIRGNELMPVALHEAGHAVMAHSMGFRLGEVTIVPSDDTLGACRYTYDLDEVRASSWVRVGKGDYRPMTEEERVYSKTRQMETMTAMVCAAGPYAQTLVGFPAHGGADEDLARLAAWARTYRQKRKSEHRQARDLIGRMGRLLNNPRRERAILALARVLLERRTLTGKEARKVIRGAMWGEGEWAPTVAA